MRDRALATIAFVGLTVGVVLALLGQHTASDAVWGGVIVLLVIPETWQVLATLRAGRVGVDAIALLAMVTALAMQEYLAGAVVALMLSGGNALESWAATRSRRELRALLERAPRSAHRIVEDRVEEVAVEALAPGDRVSVRAGEVLPVDGILISDQASVDESALTGESLPVSHLAGGALRSGTLNANDAFEMRATRSAADSAYSRLIALVREAETNRAPLVRMADRFAMYLLVFTLVIAGSAWALSGDSIRFLAVLVVATPCPLILAAPIAFIAGVSRAAARGIIVKGGSAIEGLGRARTVLLDKTGTLTLGQPMIERVESAGEIADEELMRLTASLDQMSAHVLAEALVADVAQRGIALSLPTEVDESPGEGIVGVVDGHRVVAGTADLLREHGIEISDGGLTNADARLAIVHVGVDGVFGGTLLLADQLRSDAGLLRKRLNKLGIDTVAMLTGDHAETAVHVARAAGIEDVRAELDPDQKLEIVREMRSDPKRGPVVMVGDGVNDAPALAEADVGIAMGTAGATAAAEAADVVIAVPEIDRVAEAIAIGQRSEMIALQSILVGIGLSVVAMILAALGFIPPVAGALLQEVIDIAVILNALRALR